MKNAWTLPARIKGLTMLTLSSAAARLALQPSVIKVDVEGAELDIIGSHHKLGAAAFFSEGVDQVMIELHAASMKAYASRWWALLEVAAAHGFRLWRTETSDIGGQRQEIVVYFLRAEAA